MKKVSLIGLALLLLLSGCAPPNNDSEDEGVLKTEDEESKAIIPKYKISDKYYQHLLPFEVSKARGQVVSNLNTRYDVNEMELGLMRIAQENFDPENYVFREGQYLSASTVNKWLDRKYTKEQFDEIIKKAKKQDRKVKESDNLGLNPIDPGKGDITKRNEENPLYLAHILEQNYMLKKGKDKVALGGVVIGLALNSTHYYQKEEFGAVFEAEIPYKKMVSEGKKIADEVLQRLRKKDELKNVPITIALYEQAEKSSVVPGNFIGYTHVGEGKNQITSWEDVDEKYYLFPNDKTNEKYRDDHKIFLNFKEDVENYFPNFNGVVGRGYYYDDQLQEMKIEIPIQFYGKAEAVGFTQFVTGKMLEHFPEYLSVQISVTSVNGPEAIIVRNANSKEPFVHIYQ